MLYATTALLALVVALAVGGALHHMRPPVVGEVLLHTKRPDDQTIRGVLVGSHRGHYALEQARSVVDGREVDIAGRALVPRPNVAWIQHVPPAPPSA